MTIEFIKWKEYAKNHQQGIMEELDLNNNDFPVIIMYQELPIRLVGKNYNSKELP
ncbi:hypothetical protein Syun_017168 [Stephania yunnanensis]|uniref:Uncharacterized protein n=1 Tax=Stephania yunnanensis TaxID=152371 RepID=A0AAP0J8P5_9MAGN